MLIDDALIQKVSFFASGELKAAGDDVTLSDYAPDERVKEMTAIIRNFFQWGDNTMRKPRREFNDMSVLTRMMVDQMSFNIYQPNNGQAFPGDLINSWKSQAMRPIVRNKAMSIAAHVSARMLFPKVFARNESSDSQEDAATVMRDLIEFASDQNDYGKHTLYAIITACFNPVSIVHTEFAEAYRTIKTDQKPDGGWNTKEILDEDHSGFILTPVPCDEFFIDDFYGGDDIQKHDRILWRRVQSYPMMQAKYGKCANFKYVKPGVQVIYNDANTSFYEVYDSNMRQSLCEEIIFYCKSLDLQISMVNGVMMSEPDAPNPRMDKKHPFIAFGYENLDEGRCFYKKSLAFKMQPDADIINTLYPMIIDGTYLNLMPPLIVAGEEEIGSDVVIPGVVTTLMNPEAAITPLRVGQDIRTGMETLMKVEESINESSEQPISFGAHETAYAMSLKQSQAQTLLGPFIQMIASYVKQYGELVKNDIVQYMTLPDVQKIVGDEIGPDGLAKPNSLVFQTFIVNDRKVDGGTRSRKIQFDGSLPSTSSPEEELNRSYDILEEQGGMQTGEEIYKVNPSMFRDLKYMVTVSPDVITPMSDEMEKAMGLELFDRAIHLPSLGVPVDLDAVAKDFLFGLYPGARNDVDKYFKDPQPMGMDQGMGPDGQPMQGGGMPGQAPVNPQNNTQLGQPPTAPTSPLAASGRVSPMAAVRNNPITTPQTLR